MHRVNRVQCVQKRGRERVPSSQQFCAWTSAKTDATITDTQQSRSCAHVSGLILSEMLDRVSGSWYSLKNRHAPQSPGDLCIKGCASKENVPSRTLPEEKTFMCGLRRVKRKEEFKKIVKERKTENGTTRGKNADQR